MTDERSLSLPLSVALTSCVGSTSRMAGLMAGRMAGVPCTPCQAKTASWHTDPSPELVVRYCPCLAVGGPRV